ncbi:MAG: CoA transferase [Pseudomonadota bacterium]
MDGIFSDVRIIDLSQGMAGSIAALLLAELGADVVMVEPPGASTKRQIPGAPVWNRSKRSVVLDIHDAEQRLSFNQLLASADALIHDYTPERAIAAGLDDATLRKSSPQLIVSAIGSYPPGHPLAETSVDDALVLAQMGVFDEHMPARRSGPMYYRFPLGSWTAAYLAANGLVTRLRVRDHNGIAGAVSTSLIQGALVPMMQYWFRTEHPDRSSESWIHKESGSTIHQCADGLWLQAHTPPPDSSPTMKAALAAMSPEELAAANATRPKIISAPNCGANALIFKTRPRDFWVAEMRAADLPVMPVEPFGSAYTEAQAIANAYVVEVNDPEHGPVRQPGPPLRISPAPCVSGPAPRAGQHQEEVLAQWRPRPRSLPSSADVPPQYPLQGLKVVDFGMFVAGPLAPMMLAHLGAEVIKVEPVNGDTLRMGSWAFMSAQRDKRVLALNIKDPAARPIVEKLVAWADVVHHNLRMPAAEKLGLGYDSLKAIKPDIIYSHVSAYGLEGPWQTWPGLDPTVQSASGWEIEGSSENNPPIWFRYGMFDHLCAMGSLLATLAALRHRDKTGDGQFVDVSLYGAAILTTGETMMKPDGTLTPYPRIDEMQLGVSPGRRIYQCSDGWISLVAEGPGMLDHLHRQAEGKELDAWFGSMSVQHAIVQAHDAGAEAVKLAFDNREAFLDDPLNLETRLLADTDHLHYGKLRQSGSIWNFSDMQTCIERAAPTLGQHSRELLEEFGLSTEEIDDLFARGVVV